MPTPTFKIVGYDNNNQPYNTNILLDSPKYVNTKEYVNFYYTSDLGISLKGIEKWIWDFDFANNIKDYPIQTLYGQSKPIPALFNKKGNRVINVKIFDQFYKKDTKIQKFNEQDIRDNFLPSEYAYSSNNSYLFSYDSDKIMVLDSADIFSSYINLSNPYTQIVENKLENKIYILTIDSKIDILDTISNSIIHTIDLSIYGYISEIVFNTDKTNIYGILNDQPYSSILKINTTSYFVDSYILTISDIYLPKMDINDNLYFISQDSIFRFYTSSNTHTSILTSYVPANYCIDNNKQKIYIRTSASIDAYDIATDVISNTITTLPFIECTDIVLNTIQEELYYSEDTKIKCIDLSTLLIKESKERELSNHYSIYYNEYLNLIFTNTNKFIKVLDTTTNDFSVRYTINSTYPISKFKNKDTKFYGLPQQVVSNGNPNAPLPTYKLAILSLIPSNSTKLIDGILLYEDTKSFYVYEFPTSISGLEYATEDQIIEYKTDESSNYAQIYEWSVNGVTQTETSNIFNLTFSNLVAAKVKLIITNGKQKRELMFKTAISVGTAVIGKRYDNNVKSKLKFFNKEGDYLNFDYNSDEYWEGDLIFHENSSDTFKTIGLYILESVDPIQFKSENLNTRKIQFFNENGFDIDGSTINNETFYISKIETSNKEANYYSKWIYSDNIEKKFSIGSEIYLSNIYNDLNILISDFDSISNNNFYTVVGIKKGALLILTATNNQTYNHVYSYGAKYDNNNILMYDIPQGVITRYNIFKSYDTELLNVEYNEPFLMNGLYDKKKVSLIGSQKNDGIYTVNQINNLPIPQKYILKNKILISELLSTTETRFKIRLEFKTSKLSLGSIPVSFFPASTNPFLNERSILMWDYTLNKDYTPTILKKDSQFYFEPDQIETNLDNLYTAIRVDQISNILTIQSSTINTGYKFILSNHSTLSDIQIIIELNNVSRYVMTENIAWKKGDTLANAATSLAKYMNDTIIGLTVITDENILYVYEKSGYEMTLLPDNIEYIKGALDTNNPKYGIVGDNWVVLNESYNGYIHYNDDTEIFNILYVSNSVNYWTAIPKNKKVVWTEQTTKINTTTKVDINFRPNLIAESYLEDTTVYFESNKSVDIVDINNHIENFILSNKSNFIGYGLDIYTNSGYLVLENLYSIDSNNYVDTSFLVYDSLLSSYVPKISIIENSIIDIINVLEPVIAEKNRNIGNYLRPKQISKLFRREIIIKRIDSVTGLTIQINGINYHVPFSNVDIQNVSDTEENILSVENTLLDWGNSLFTVQQDINDTVSSIDIGKKYYEVLEYQGVMVWLSKSEESFVSGIKRYDTLVIESKYPNITINYNISGVISEFDTKILHSDILFNTIYTELSLTINNTVYTVKYNSDIETTINDWIYSWYDTLLESNIIVNVISSNILRISTTTEKTLLKYTVWVGKTPLVGIEYYKITGYRNSNSGLILSGNEIRNNITDFQEVGFSTAMIVNFKNSKFPLNNQQYNLVFVEPSILGLSYQGAFWDNEDDIYKYKLRTSFDWELYEKPITYHNNNGVYTTSGLVSIPTLLNSGSFIEYDTYYDTMWVANYNNVDATIITIYDQSDYTVLNTISIPVTISYMLYDYTNNKMYIISDASSNLYVTNTQNYTIENVIPLGITPLFMIIDSLTNYLYVLCIDSSEIIIIDISNSYLPIHTLAVGDLPYRMSIDKVSRLLYVSCQASDNVHIIDLNSFTTKNIIQLATGSTPSDILWILDSNKVVVSNFNAGTITIIYYNNNSFITKLLNVGDNPNNIIYDNISKRCFIDNINTICVLDMTLDIQIDTILNDSNIGHMMIVPYNKSLFYTLPNINSISHFKLDDPFYVKTTIDNLGSIPIMFRYSNLNEIWVININDYYLNILKETFENITSTPIIYDTDLIINSSEFLRYPRERYSDHTTIPIYYKFSWKDEEADDNSMFFYDFSGKQLYLKNADNERFIDKGIYNYIGETPLTKTSDTAYLRKEYNNDLKYINNPKFQQTVFDETYHDLIFLDSEDVLDSRPDPIQIFIGYNSKQEGVNKKVLVIERLENIDIQIVTNLNGVDTVEFDSEQNELRILNTNINLIEHGFIKDQIIEIKGKDITNKDGEATFYNSGLICKIEKVFISKLKLIPINKQIVSEKTLTTTYSSIPPYRPRPTSISVNIKTLPTKIAEINIKGQTEIEDDRYRVMLDNFGYNILERDTYIFKEYDIKESGLDWKFLNNKRKEMCVNYSDIWNYLGSYKALINSVNYFGYNDLEVNEYYKNIDSNSKSYGKLHKIEIPDIFDPSTKGYKPSDQVLKSLPNKTYEKTKLFNLTYRITDLDGNYVLGYSLDEIITKLLGLKKWLRNNIMPIGTNIKDLTGRADDMSTINIKNDVKQLRTFKLTESLVPINFKIESYLQPIENNSKTYNVHLEFFTKDESIPDYFTVNIKTYNKESGNIIQNLNYYKTDLKHLNLVADRNIDPFIEVKVVSYNNYGSVYTVKRTYSLDPNS